MSNHWMECVREFHEKTGLKVRETPGLEDVRLRMKLMQEEMEELRRAVWGLSGQARMIEIADALGDLIYVICGSAISWGIDLDRVVREIHRSNMTKLCEPILRNKDGKILKGPKYEKPDLNFLLGESNAALPGTTAQPSAVQG